jgi:hypothetical protein
MAWAMTTHCIVLLGICVIQAIFGTVADAQQPKKAIRLCYLGNAISGRQAVYIKMFRGRLRDLGYVEGQNLTMIWLQRIGFQRCILSSDLLRLAD